MTIDMKIFQNITPTNITPVHKNRFSVARTAGTMPVYQAPALAANYAPTKNTITLATTNPLNLGFKDVIDSINPLQHIPIVSTVYRKVTDDEISPAARFAGGTLFGGPIGGALALADIAIKDQTGTTMGEKMFNLVSNDFDTQNNQPLELKNTPFKQHDFEKQRMAGTVPIWQGASPATKIAAMVQPYLNIDLDIG
jgi:hypothetical protein